MSNHSKFFLYIIVVILTVGFCIGCYIYNTNRFVESQQRIIQAYEKSMACYDTISFASKNLQIQMAVEGNIKHQEEVKALLELEFNKIQNEYETQEIWTGILTIVFLIFSFYSLFKSEEMERKGQEALGKIEANQTKSQTAYEGIEAEKNAKILSLQTQYDSWKVEKESELLAIVNRNRQEIANSYKQNYESSVKELQKKYRETYTSLLSELNSNANHQLEKLKRYYESQLVNLIHKFEQTNAAEIRKQMERWSEQFKQQRDDITRQFNEMMDSMTPLTEADIDEIFKNSVITTSNTEESLPPAEVDENSEDEPDEV